MEEAVKIEGTYIVSYSGFFFLIISNEPRYSEIKPQ